VAAGLAFVGVDWHGAKGWVDAKPSIIGSQLKINGPALAGLAKTVHSTPVSL
jgi:hypothetical protein